MAKHTLKTYFNPDRLSLSLTKSMETRGNNMIRISQWRKQIKTNTNVRKK